jgi:hypothetical protein
MTDVSEGRVDQRRSPRVDVEGEAWLELDVCATVRIVDIGGGGAMVAGLVPTAPGERATLRTVLDGQPVELPFEVSWRRGAGRERGPSCAGGAFDRLVPETRRRLEGFFSRER